MATEGQQFKSFHNDFEEEEDDDKKLQKCSNEPFKSTSNLNLKIKDHNSTIEELEIHLMKVEDELSETKSAMFQKSMSYEDEMLSKIKIINELRKDVEDFENKIMPLETKVSKLEQQNTHLESIISEQKLCNEKLLNEKNLIEAEFIELQQKHIVEKEQTINDTKIRDSNFPDDFSSSTELGQEVTDLLLKEKDNRLSELEKQIDENYTLISNLKSEKFTQGEKIQEMDQRITELECKNTSAASELKVKDNLLVALNKLVVELTDEVQKADKKVSSAASVAELEDVRSECQTKSETVEALSTELDCLKKNYTIKEDLLDNAKNLILEMRQMMTSKEENMVAIEDKLKRVLIEYDDNFKVISCLKSKNIDLVKDVNLKNEQLLALQDQCSMFNEVNAKYDGLMLQVEMAETLNDQYYELEINYKGKEKLVAALKNDISTLTSTLKNRNSSISELEKKLTNVEKELSEKNENLFKLTQKNSDQRIEIQTKSEEISLLEDKSAELERIKTECQDLHMQISFANAEVNQLEDLKCYYEVKERTLVVANNDISNLKTELINKEGELELLKEDLRCEKEEMNARIKRISDLEVQNWNLLNELRLITDQIFELRTKNETLEEIRVKYEELQSKLEGENKMKIEYEELQQRHKVKEEEITALHTKILEMMSTISRRDEDLSLLKNTCKELESRLDETHSTITDLELKNSDLETNFNFKVAQLLILEEKSALVDEVTSQCEALRWKLEAADTVKVELESLRCDYKIKEDLLASANNDLAEMKLKMSNKDNVLMAIEETLHGKENEINKVQLAMAEIELSNSRLINQLQLKADEVSCLENKLNEITTLYSNLQKEMEMLSVLKPELESVKQNLKVKEEVLAAAKNEILSIKVLIKSKDETLSFMQERCRNSEKELNEKILSVSELEIRNSELLTELKLKIEQVSSYEDQRIRLDSMNCECEYLRNQLQITKSQKLEETQLKIKEDSLSKLSNEVAQLKTALQYKEESVASLKTKIVSCLEEKKAELNQVHFECNALRKRADELQKALQQTHEAFERDKVFCNNVVVQLKNEISNKEIQLHELRKFADSRSSLMNELTETKSNYEVTLNINNRLKSSYDQLQNDFVESLKKNSLLEKKQFELEKRIKSDFEAQLINIKQKMKQCWNDEMQKKNDEFRDKLSQYKEKVINLLMFYDSSKYE